MPLSITETRCNESGLIELLIAEVQKREGADEARTLDVRIGSFWTVVNTSVGAGLASTLAGEARPHEGVPVADAGALHKRPPLELAELLRSGSPPEAAVGLAAVNALIGSPRGRNVTFEKAVQVLQDRGRNKRVAVIGRFPFAEKLRPSCRELWVFERGEDLKPGEHGAAEIPELLPKADVVAVTATTLLNHTINDVVRHLGKHAWTMMLGPSTPMAHGLLERGFDVLCGTVVDDVKAVLAVVSQGGVTKQIFGVKRVCMWKKSK
jgi:uncharacterized protein (DUF4213/DUF364 family)